MLANVVDIKSSDLCSSQHIELLALLSTDLLPCLHGLSINCLINLLEKSSPYRCWIFDGSSFQKFLIKVSCPSRKGIRIPPGSIILTRRPRHIVTQLFVLYPHWHSFFWQLESSFLMPRLNKYTEYLFFAYILWLWRNGVCSAQIQQVELKR